MRIFIILVLFSLSGRISFAEVTARIISANSDNKTMFDRIEYFIVVQDGKAILSKVPLLNLKGQQVFRSLLYGTETQNKFVTAIYGDGLSYGNYFVFPVRMIKGDVQSSTYYLFSKSGRWLGEIVSRFDISNDALLLKEASATGSKKLSFVTKNSGELPITLVSYTGNPIKLQKDELTHPLLTPVRLKNGWIIFKLKKKVFLANPDGSVIRKLVASSDVRSLHDLIAEHADGTQSFFVKLHKSSEFYFTTTKPSGFDMNLGLFEEKFVGSKILLFAQTQFDYLIAVLQGQEKQSSKVVTFDHEGKVIDTKAIEFNISQAKFINNVIYVNESNACAAWLSKSNVASERFLLDSLGNIHKIYN